jgi:hypothetical protein
MKHPDTAAAVREHVGEYGLGTMTTMAENTSTKSEGNKRREEATAGKAKVPGTAIDEEPPASFRKPGDPVTTKRTSIKESQRKHSWEI